MSGTLAHTPSQVLRQALIDLGHGADGGTTWPVYATAEPNAPDSVITVYDTSGVKQARQQVNGQVVTSYGTMIRVRSNDIQTAWNKANTIAIALDEDIQLTSVTVTDPEGYGTATQDYVLWNVSRSSGPLPVHDPDSDLKAFTLNVLIKLKQAA